MNRTIKEATVKRYHYDNHDQLSSHLFDFLDAYNYARRLKTLSGLKPYEYICKTWTSRARSIHLKSDPPDARTDHLGDLQEFRQIIHTNNMTIDHIDDLQFFLVQTHCGGRTSVVHDNHAKAFVSQ